MNDYKEVVTMLATKLKADKADTSYRDGGMDLHYIMSVKLQDIFINEAHKAGLGDFETLTKVASGAADEFLNGMIELADK